MIVSSKYIFASIFCLSSLSFAQQTAPASKDVEQEVVEDVVPEKASPTPSLGAVPASTPVATPVAKPASVPAPKPSAAVTSSSVSDPEEMVEDEPPTIDASAVVEAAVPQKSLLKSVADSNFNKPLFFDSINHGVVLAPLELDYAFSSENGSQLRIGNVRMSEKNFVFSVVSLAKSHPGMKNILSSSKAENLALLIRWPQGLFSHGTLEMISKTGEVLWSVSISEEDRKEWKKQLDDWKKELIEKGVDKRTFQKSVLFSSQYGITDVLSAKAPFRGATKSFRFCLKQTDGRNSTKLCSQRYGFKPTAGSVVMGKMKNGKANPRVLLNNEAAPLQNVTTVSSELPTSFFAEFSTGESYEFVTVPNKLSLMDISEGAKTNTLKVVGFDPQPLGAFKILNPESSGGVTKLLGFESTIGDTRKFWLMNISKEKPQIFLPGRVGGVFKQKFELSEIPRGQSRVFLHKDTPTGTYIDGIVLDGRKQPVSKITSDQNSVTANSQDASLFEWNFRAKERGQINRSYLNVELNGKTYRSYYEIFKGFPRELSGRFIGVASSTDFVFMGEVAYNQWFEDLFGWKNYWASRQRWGLSAKYFQAFSDIKLDQSSVRGPFNVLTVDLKYRLSPGLWGRDETLGALLSYQAVTIHDLQAPMLGAGAFWARSMPRVFDDMFNYFSFLRYPKWVDVEFLYYAAPMNSDITLKAPMSLNFHGKILWTSRFFGEAGFGIKRYGFSDAAKNQQAELNTFYGTVGLGLNF